MQGGAGDWSGELREETRDEGGGATVRDEEDRLGQFGDGLFLRSSLRSLRVSSLLLWFGRLARVEREGVREGAEVEEEVDEVDFSDLRGDEDVVLGEASGGRNPVKLL